MSKKSFGIESVATLNLKLNAPIEIKLSPNNKLITVDLQIDETDEGSFKVWQEQDTVFVQQESSNFGGGNIFIGDITQSVIGVGNFIGGRNIIQSAFSGGRGGSSVSVVNGVRMEIDNSSIRISFSGKNDVNVTRTDRMPSQISGANISIVGNVVVQKAANSINLIVPDSRDVYVNGVIHNQNTEQVSNTAKSKPYQSPKVVIYVPAQSDLEADLDGNSFSPEVPFGNVLLTVSEGVQVKNLRADDLDVSADEASNVQAIINGGVLSINADEGSIVSVSGIWSKADVSADEGSSVVTSGTCNGNYSAKADEGSSIIHSGTITGKKRKHSGDGSSIVLG